MNKNDIDMELSNNNKNFDDQKNQFGENHFRDKEAEQVYKRDEEDVKNQPYKKEESFNKIAESNNDKLFPTDIRNNINNQIEESGNHSLKGNRDLREEIDIHEKVLKEENQHKNKEIKTPMTIEKEEIIHQENNNNHNNLNENIKESLSII